MTDVARESLDKLMALPAGEREIIAVRLLDSLEGEDEDPGEVEKTWLEEAERRIAQIDSGEVTCRPLDEVMVELRARLGR